MIFSMKKSKIVNPDHFIY